MKISVGILTHNAIKFMRLELLVETAQSIRDVFPGCRVTILDNGSNDGTTEYASKDLRRIVNFKQGVRFVSFVKRNDLPNTPGVGVTALVHTIIREDNPDVIVLSDDDMVWKAGAKEAIEDIWSHAPENLKIVSGHLEPIWDWNTPRETMKLGETNVLVRDSAPGCAWSFRAADWRHFGPLKADFGQDHDACVRLRDKGFLVAQLDLADHMGRDYSTWGNEAPAYSKPLDRARWGV